MGLINGLKMGSRLQFFLTLCFLLKIKLTNNVMYEVQQRSILLKHNPITLHTLLAGGPCLFNRQQCSMRHMCGGEYSVICAGYNGWSSV